MYKPLPDSVTIKNSVIHGLGLFSKVFIKEKTNLGITHVRDDNFEDSYIRTPLGGFFNHSADQPNCKVFKDGRYLFLITNRDIQPGEELTATYTLYNPEEM